MRSVHALVTEHFPKLIYPVKTTHDQSFEVKLIRNPQEKRHIQGIVVRLERSCRSTTMNSLKDRSFHFQPAMVVKVATHVGDDSRAGDESLLDLGIYRQVHIALTIALLRVCKAVIDISFLVSFHDRKGLHCLRKHFQLGDMK